MTPLHQKTNRGFVLLEALVAMLVLSFGILAIVGFQSTLSLNSDVAKQRTEATRLAQQKLEEGRTFEDLAAYTANMTSGSDTITTNATFARSWAVTSAAGSDTGRQLAVTVTWTDRAGNAQQVQLFSEVAKMIPGTTAGLLFPSFSGSGVRLPKNRSLGIPVPAVSISGTGKSYVPWAGATGGYVVFSDAIGDVVQKCTDVPTAANLSTSTCTVFDGYLLTGYITGDTTPRNAVTQILFSSAQYLGGTPDCSVGTAYDQNASTPTAIPNTRYYACLIVPTDHDSNASTDRVWSGRTDLAGANGASLAGTYTCRFSTDASTTVNSRHPATYSMVDASLMNQNFYISNSSCASTSANRVAHLTNTGTSFRSVTYHANGGTGPLPSTTLRASGDTVTVATSPSPEKVGFTFGGWSRTQGGAAETTFTIAADTTLYAVWTSGSTYSVTYDAYGGTGSVPPVSTHAPGDAVTIATSPSPSKVGFNFVGWSRTAGGGAETTFTIAGNTTLYAVWTTGPVTTYTVTYDSNQGTGSVPPNTVHASGSMVTIASSPSPSRDNYNFVGWSRTQGGAAETTFAISGDTTLYAVWTATTMYTVTYDTNGGTGGTPAGGSYASGSTVTVPTTPTPSLTNHTFGGWSRTPGGTSVGASFVITADTPLYARWVLPTPVPAWNTSTRVLSWATVPGATSYSVRTCTGTSTSCTLGTATSQTALTTAVQSPSNGNSVCFTVAAVSAAATSAESGRYCISRQGGYTYTP